jgi:hypothetical protein
VQRAVQPVEFQVVVLVAVDQTVVGAEGQHKGSPFGRFSRRLEYLYR